MSEENYGNQNGGADLTAIIRAALPNRPDLELAPEDVAELAASYRDMLRDYREHSAGYLAKEDFRQAAEKAWGSYAESVKSIAADHGFRLSHHGHIIRVGNRLATVAGRTDENARLALLRGLNSARSLHQHFYENDLEAEGVVMSSGEVLTAIDLMQQRFSASANGGGPPTS